MGTIRIFSIWPFLCLFLWSGNTNKLWSQKTYIWTPNGSRNGPIKKGLSVLLSKFPSFGLTGHFLGIVSLIFSKFWHGARIPCDVVLDRVGFSRKFFLPPKIGKMGPKWAKNRVFSIYWKIWSLIFTEFDL